VPVKKCLLVLFMLMTSVIDQDHSACTHHYVACCRTSQKVLEVQLHALREICASPQSQLGVNMTARARACLRAANELSAVPRITSGQEETFRLLFDAHLPVLIQLNCGVVGDWDPETWKARHGHREVTACIVSNEKRRPHSKKMELAAFLDQFMDHKRTKAVKLSVFWSIW
jgi:hypothetical protein